VSAAGDDRGRDFDLLLRERERRDAELLATRPIVLVGHSTAAR
jgi:hypothetical protein